MKALIGHSGYVGTTLKGQAAFDRLYRSTDIDAIRGGAFDVVVCAGVSAKKWVAERDPVADLAAIQALAGHLETVSAERFVLISTVDVFADSRGADEHTATDAAALGAYGGNRLWLERFVTEKFSRPLIVRLAGLVGPHLRKNAVFDLRNGNALHLLDARGVYQFYPMVNLWSDIGAALGAGLDLIHLTAEPLSIRDVARDGFGIDFDNVLPERTPAVYDFRSCHAALLGGRGDYTYSARESLTAIRAYAQSEPASAPVA